MTPINVWKSFGGTLSVHDHDSTTCQCLMRFAVYTPPAAKKGPVPVLWYLSGLTCNWSNVMEKSGLQRLASELGLMIVAPDTSPRGADVADDPAYDMGQGASFYLTATQEPWSKHFRMDQYITEELSALIAENFPADMSRQGIFGHSMGGHGALTLHLKNPETYRSVSAFAPIVAPTQVAWGENVYTAHLGEDRTTWDAYDACALVARQPSSAHILIDQGEADQFIESELRPELFEVACAKAGQSLTLRRQPGYDHSYWFIGSFMDDHLRHHARVLVG
jgi:S-formylglutathione hydrolase